MQSFFIKISSIILIVCISPLYGQTYFKYSINSDGSDNHIVKSIKKIKNAEQIKYLKIDFYHKKNFPQEIFNFKNLKTLIIWNSNIDFIPENIIYLQQLQHLEIVICPIASIKFDIGELENLEDLIISETLIHEIPLTVWQLKKLKHLDLSENDNLILDSIGFLPELEELNIRHNVAFNVLPKGIQNLTSLTCIRLNGLGINYNEELIKLKNLFNLSFLEISFSKLEEFPHSLFDLYQLEEIVARGNNFDHFPDSFRKISGLKRFDLGLNKTKIKHSERDNLKRMLPICEIFW